jgi:hypothetical protein
MKKLCFFEDVMSREGIPYASLDMNIVSIIYAPR